MARKPLPGVQTLASGAALLFAWDRKPSAVSEEGGNNSSLFFPSAGGKERSTVALCSS